jgi:hypothetical protein
MPDDEAGEEKYLIQHVERDADQRHRLVRECGGEHRTNVEVDPRLWLSQRDASEHGAVLAVRLRRSPEVRSIARTQGRSVCAVIRGRLPG